MSQSLYRLILTFPRISHAPKLHCIWQKCKKKKTKNKNISKRKLTTKQKHLESQLESNLDLIRDYSICKCYVYLTYEQNGRQNQNREQNKTQQRQAKTKWKWNATAVWNDVKWHSWRSSYVAGSFASETELNSDKRWV